MASIRIVENHSLSPEEAKKRVQAFEEQLEKFRMKAHWKDLRAELKGTGASGEIRVTGQAVEVDVKLGLLAKAAGIDADRAENAIRKRLRQALDA
jgi:putative polyhydroxyalkanoate system protein